MVNRLDGQVSVVTGAGRGLGRVYAGALAAEGASVVVNDNGSELGGLGTSRGPADAVVEEITQAGGKAIANYEDVSDWQSAGRIVEAAVDHFGRLDVMITNAGADRRGWVLELTPEDWESTLKVHINGSINCALQAAQVMRSQGSGAIIIITSGAFYSGVLRLAPYVVSKGAVYSLMRALSQELQPFGISVNAISPRALTRASDSWISSLQDVEDYSQEQVDALRAGYQETEAMGPLAAFLPTEEGRKITGQVLSLNKDKLSLIGPPSASVVAFSPSGRWDVDSLVSIVPRMVEQVEAVPTARR